MGKCKLNKMPDNSIVVVDVAGTSIKYVFWEVV